MEVSTAVTQHQSERAAHVPSQSIGCGSVTATQAAVRVVHSEVANAILAQGANLSAAHAVIFLPIPCPGTWPYVPLQVHPARPRRDQAS